MDSKLNALKIEACVVRSFYLQDLTSFGASDFSTYSRIGGGGVDLTPNPNSETFIL